jgi:hypothetical protein
MKGSAIPYKIFGRMLDLLIQSQNDGDAQRQLDAIQDEYRWPWRASHEQVAEWNRTYARIDPGDSSNDRVICPD